MNIDPLLGLRDLHLPPEPGGWPPAPAFWLAVALAIVLASVLLWWRRRRPSAMQLAKRELRVIEHLYRQQREDRRLLAQLARLLRRVDRERHGDVVAALGGAEWAAHLARHAPPGCQAATWELLALHRYAAQLPAMDVPAVVKDCRRWLTANAP